LALMCSKNIIFASRFARNSAHVVLQNGGILGELVRKLRLCTKSNY